MKCSRENLWGAAQYAGGTQTMNRTTGFVQYIDVQIMFRGFSRLFQRRIYTKSTDLYLNIYRF
jgi:hypothetical protein